MNYLVIALVLVAALVVWALDCYPISKEITIYTEQCYSGFKGEICYDPVVYRWYSFEVSEANKTVTYWGDKEDVQKYTNCVIKDQKNWSCLRPFMLGMKNGAVAKYGQEWLYVSKARYYFDKLTD